MYKSKKRSTKKRSIKKRSIKKHSSKKRSIKKRSIKKRSSKKRSSKKRSIKKQNLRKQRGSGDITDFNNKISEFFNKKKKIYINLVNSLKDESEKEYFNQIYNNLIKDINMYYELLDEQNKILKKYSYLDESLYVKENEFFEILRKYLINKMSISNEYEKKFLEDDLEDLEKDIILYNFLNDRRKKVKNQNSKKQLKLKVNQIISKYNHYTDVQFTKDITYDQLSPKEKAIFDEIKGKK
jgi:hypothetical protein